MTRNELIAATVLGLDHGLRRMGVALKPAGQEWALPIRIVAVDDEAGAVRAARRLIDEYQPAAVVVGLPLHQDPTQAQVVRRFARKAREATRGVRWLFMDEQFSTQEAEQIASDVAADHGLPEAELGYPDDMAAKLILERYLARLE